MYHFFLKGMAVAFLSLTSASALALTCQQVRQLTAVYLKMHYSFNNFDDELSTRTLDFFVRNWDSGKLYFYQSDVDEIKDKYGKKLDDMILAANCKAIHDIVNIYNKRFAERSAEIPKLIDLKHDFKVDEYMEIDRKKLQYAKDAKEINERWRQRVKFQLLQLKKTLTDLKKSKDKLLKRYQLAEKQQTEQTTDDVYAAFLNSFSSSLDPHSEYMAPEQLEDFRIQTRLSLEGIGAVLRTEDGFTIIQSLVPGGAASKSGKLKVEDKIIAVGQEKGEPVDVIDMKLRDVVNLIRGARGTKVMLTVVREEAGKSSQTVVPIVREKVQLTDRTAKGRIEKVQIEVDGKKQERKIGVLNLPSFYIDFEGQHNKVSDYRSSARDLQDEITKLKKDNIDALVLDLRTNGGGSLTESIKVAGMFFDKGPVVQIKESDGSSYPQADTDGVTFYNGPLLVMISRQSASASEIFAGAIQDYERGLIVGDDHTFGKGTVQNLNDIGAKLGATKVTISKFYRPSGSSTQLKGVTSDIVLPSIIGELEIGEKHYDYALPWDQIKNTEFKTFSLVKPFVDKLKLLSAERIKSDAGFKKIDAEIAEYRKNKDERTRVSLNETEKKKDAAEEEEKRAEEEEGGEVKLEDDLHMQESIRIAADYVQLIENKKTGKLVIESLKDVKLVGNKDKKASSKEAPAKQTN